MKVYIVRDHGYDEYGALFVFSTMEKAEDFIKNKAWVKLGVPWCDVPKIEEIEVL